VEANDEIMRIEKEHKLYENPYRPEKWQSEIWITGFGDLAHQSAKDENPAFRMTSGGVVAGWNRAIDDCTCPSLDSCVINHGLAYTYSSIQDEDNFGHSSIQSG